MNKIRIALTLCLLLLSAVPSHVSAFPANAPAPTVTGISPTQAYNYQATTVTITGTNFVATPTVMLGNVSLANVTFVDSATLTAIVPSDLPAGSYTLAVTNPDNQSENLVNGFTVIQSGNGGLGSWQAQTLMNTAREAYGAVVSGDYVYVVGGTTGTIGSDLYPVNSVERAVINSDGTLGTWQNTTPMSIPRTQNGLATANGWLYAIGGNNNGTILSSVERAQINSDGSLSSWQSATPLSKPRWNGAAATWGTYIYLLGGLDDQGVPFSYNERVIVNPDGSLGSWQTVNSMLTRRSGLAVIATNGYLYALGGDGNPSGVERAKINLDGTLDPWQFTTSMNTPRTGLATATSRDYLYAIGGWGLPAGGPYGPVSVAERATINQDGSLGPWEATTSMTTPRSSVGGIAKNGYIYAFGGWNGTVLTSTERAIINYPTLDSVSPSAVPVDRSTPITIMGNNFLPTPILRLANTTTLSVSFISTTTLTSTVPFGLVTGWYTVTLTNPNGIIASRPNALLVDGIAPTGNVTINEGTSATNSTNVTLALTATDDSSGVAQMSFSNDGTNWTAWQNYATSASWTLPSGDGSKTVYARYKDNAGNISSVTSATIALDTTPPSGSILIAGGASYTNSSIVNLTLNANDAVSGVAQMSFSNDGSSWSTWENYATSKAWTLSAGDGNKTVYARYKDNVGNISTPVSSTIIFDTTVPNGSITINAGAAATSSTAVTLNITATDATSGVAQMSFSNDGTNWNAWQSYASTSSWILPTGDGTKTVYARFKDNAGNISSSTSTNIVLDTIAPTGTVIINGGAAYTNSTIVQLTLSATDSGSGVAQMSFSNDGSTWSSWQTYKTSANWTLSSGDGTKTVYVRYNDNAGNISSPVSANITLDTTAPTGSITINNGANFANSVSVSLALSASDTGSGVAQMSFSDDGTSWYAWETYSTSKVWTLSTGDGNKTVYVRYQDNATNISTPISANIILDTVPPSAAVNALNAYQSSLTFNVTWWGTDATSGLANYDVQYQDGAGAWTDWQTATTAITASFTGQDTHTYGFRARARDNAGNVSSYSAGDTQTTIDVTQPTATSLGINGGALSTTSPNVSVSVIATDPNVSSRAILTRAPRNSGVAQISLSNDGSAWSDWQTYSTSVNWTLTSGDGSKTVYARVKDAAGNVSSVISGTTTLDTAAGTQYGVTINDGALYTNQISVTLTIGALPGTSRMMESNDGGFAGAQWEPYSSRKAWTITQYGSYVIPRTVYVRYGDTNGNVLNTSQDDIILDVNPPVGSVTIVSSSSSAARRPNTTVTLSLNATDDVSGVGGMTISNQPSFAGANWESYTTSRTWTLGGNNTVYVRFKDNAGNISQTYSASLEGQQRLFLPLIVK